MNTTLQKLIPALALVLLVSGCAKDSGTTKRGDSDKIQLVLTIPGGMRERPLYERVAEQFMADYPNVEVEVRPVTGSGKYYQKVQVMIAGGEPPDLMWMGQSFSEFADRGAFLDITERISSDIDTAKFLPASLTWYQMNERQYGIPFGIDVQFLVYNKALFDAAGVAYPSADWDYDEFLQKAKQLTLDTDDDGTIDQYGFRGHLEKSLFGAEFISPDGRTARCDTPEMIAYVQTNLDLAHKHGIMPSLEESRQEALDEYTYFIQGKAAIQIMYTWNLPWLADKFADLDWDIALNPRVAQRGQWASSQGVVIAADTPHPDEAWALCRRFFGNDFQKAMAFRGVPTNYDAAKEVLAEHEGKPANLGALHEAREILYPTPRVLHLQELETQWRNNVESAWVQRATPEEAMKEAQRQLTRTINKHYPK
ncbi:MAG: ABC transporter substrate-binding protein [Lentisphaeria bacterium]